MGNVNKLYRASYVNSRLVFGAIDNPLFSVHRTYIQARTHTYAHVCADKRSIRFEKTKLPAQTLNFIDGLELIVEFFRGEKHFYDVSGCVAHRERQASRVQPHINRIPYSASVGGGGGENVPVRVLLC